MDTFIISATALFTIISTAFCVYFAVTLIPMVRFTNGFRGGLTQLFVTLAVGGCVRGLQYLGTMYHPLSESLFLLNQHWLTMLIWAGISHSLWRMRRGIKRREAGL